MPTGHHGGFTSLDENCVGRDFELTAKEGIDMATDEIIMQVCDHPERATRMPAGAERRAAARAVVRRYVQLYTDYNTEHGTDS